MAGLFRKKNKRGKNAPGGSDAVSDATRKDVVEPAEDDEGKRNRGGGRRKKQRQKRKSKRDMMSSILSESVAEASLEIFRETPSIGCERDGLPCYIGMYLRAEDIGGISRRVSNDESKGAMVEAINSGRIATLISAQMLEDEELVIIPNAMTIVAMEEFSLLVEAPYTIALVDGDGVVENTGIPMTYEETAVLVSGQEEAEHFLSRKGVSWAHGSTGELPDLGSFSVTNDRGNVVGDSDKPFGYEARDENVVVPMQQSFDEGTQNAADFDELPLYEGDDVDDEIPFDDGSEVVDDASGSDGGDGGNGLDNMFEDIPVDPREADIFTGRRVSVGDESEEVAEESPVTGDVETVTEEMVQTSLVRRFYSDDLGLEVSIEPFESHFVTDNPVIMFDEDRGEGWMNEYLSAMSRQANLELSNMHQQHLFSLRERYLTIMGMHCENILRDLDVLDPTTRFGMFKEGLVTRREERLRNITEEIDVRTRALDAEWERKIEAEAAAAAAAARKTYMDANEGLHDRQIMRIEPDIRADIEEQYSDGLHDLHDRRRLEAAKRLDLCITDTLREIADLFVRMTNEEQELRSKWQDTMAAFVEENRKDDIARIDTLARELDQADKVDETIREFKERMQAMREEFESRAAVQEKEAEAIKRANAESLARAKADAGRRETELLKQIDDLKDTYDELQNTNKDLVRQMVEKDREHEDDVRKRLEESEVAHKRELERYDSVIGEYKERSERFNFSQIALTIIAVIAALAIGAIIGLTFNITSKTNDDRAAIQQQLDERISQTNAGAATATQ